jgi:hypothetical protein
VSTVVDTGFHGRSDDLDQKGCAFTALKTNINFTLVEKRNKLFFALRFTLQ